MSIANYLVDQRRKLIRNHRLGFGTNPDLIPTPDLMPTLDGVRKAEFLQFRKGLRVDGVIIIKVLTAADVSALQEGILFGNLRGEFQLINLSEVSAMSDDERRNDERLMDLKTLLDDPKTFKVVERLPDLLKFGERVSHRLEADKFAALEDWHPKMKNVFASTVRYEHPRRYAALTLSFGGVKHHGWKWTLSQDSELLGEEQRRLCYAVTSSLVSLTLDGIV